jgi:MoxR-like ATPase
MKQTAQFAQATPAVLLQSLRACVLAKRPAFTWGNPGIGKSDLHRRLADDLGREILDLRASQWDAVDTRGIPHVIERDGETVTRWAIPDIFPTDPNSTTIIFLDELNSAAPSVQAALYQLILDRKLGFWRLAISKRIERSRTE